MSQEKDLQFFLFRTTKQLVYDLVGKCTAFYEKVFRFAPCFSFKAARHCDTYQCDTQTTECQGDTFPECKCKPGLEKTEWDERSCSGKNLAALPIPERLTCLFPLSVPF